MTEPEAFDEGRGRRGRLRWHALALGLALAALWPVLRLEGAFTVDEGSYAVQARALGEGTWDMGYAFSAVDGERRFVPYHGAVLSDDGEVLPYPKHPAVPAVLRAAAVPFGEAVGFRLFGVGSVLALAAVAWSIAGELGPARSRPWAFWMAATGPVLANAWMVWPHAPSAALGGLVVLAALRVDRSVWWLPVAALASAAGVLARAEGLLFAAAVALALLGMAQRPRQRVAGAAVGAAALLALGAERWWRADLVGDGATLDLAPRGGGSALGDRLTGLRLALVDGAVADGAATVLSAAALAVVVLVALRWRRGEATPQLAGGLCALGAAALAVRYLVAANDPAIGLFAAAPVLVLGVAWRPAGSQVRWVLGVLLLFLAAIAVSIYPDGGALQWGGRFFSPALGLLSAVAGAAVATHLPAEGRRPAPADPGPRPRIGRWPGGRAEWGIAAVLAVQAAGALVVPDRMRAATQANLEALVDEGESVIVAGGRMIARLDWRSWPDRCWISIPAGGDDADTREVLGVLAASGVASAAYAGIDPDALRRAGATVRPDPGTPRIGTLDVPDPAPARRIAAPYSCPAR